MRAKEGSENDGIVAIAANAGLMPETLVEQINEIALDILGNLLIEDGEIIDEHLEDMRANLQYYRDRREAFHGAGQVTRSKAMAMPAPLSKPSTKDDGHARPLTYGQRA